jgi:hypothetical protein
MKTKDWKLMLDDVMRIDTERNELNLAIMKEDIILYRIRMEAKTKWFRKQLDKVTFMQIK